MAIFRHISTKMVLVLDAGTKDGKKTTKRVTISNIREDAPADALWELAQALGKVLAHPMARVLLYKEEAIEREEADEGAAWVNDGTAAVKGLQYDEHMVRVGGGPAFPLFVQRGSALSGKKAAARADGKHTARLGKHARLPPRLRKAEAANGRSPPL